VLCFYDLESLQLESEIRGGIEGRVVECVSVNGRLNVATVLNNVYEIEGTEIKWKRMDV